jgi:hypothetical protein
MARLGHSPKRRTARALTQSAGRAATLAVAAAPPITDDTITLQR